MPTRPVDNVDNYKRKSYGFFVHYVWSYSRVMTTYRDGTAPSSIDELANAFDAEQFAEDMAKTGVEYVIFTAWHDGMNLLYPSERICKYRDPSRKHYSDRDVIRDLIDALEPKGIPLILYCHPVVGHRFTPEDQERTGFNDGADGYGRWNDFTNDIFDEFCDRYGDQVMGYWLDGVFRKWRKGVNLTERTVMIDRRRLWRTITKHHPNPVLVFNSGTLKQPPYAHVKHYAPLFPFKFVEVTWFYPDSHEDWPCATKQLGMHFDGGYVADSRKGLKECTVNVAAIQEFTLFQASKSTDGGTAWSAGCFAGPGDIWEPNVLESMIKANEFFAPIRESLCNALPSASYVTPDEATIKSLPQGCSATQSADWRYTYLHIFKPPEGRRLQLPVPEDGATFIRATRLRTGEPVKLVQDETGVSLTIAGSWDPAVTVLKLERVR
jgi:hypothetical protein